MSTSILNFTSKFRNTMKPCGTNGRLWRRRLAIAFAASLMAAFTVAGPSHANTPMRTESTAMMQASSATAAEPAGIETELSRWACRRLGILCK